jgi:hypothetical protein
MAPRLILLISSGSKKEEPRYTCLSEAKASHSQGMWAEVSSSDPHLLHSGLSDSPTRWRCLLRVLRVCPVRRPLTALDCHLLKDTNLALAPRQGPEISSRACLWVSPRPRHHTQCWLTNQGLILRISCLEKTPKAGSGPTNFRAEPSLASSSAISFPHTPGVRDGVSCLIKTVAKGTTDYIFTRERHPRPRLWNYIACLETAVLKGQFATDRLWYLLFGAEGAILIGHSLSVLA